RSPQLSETRLSELRNTARSSPVCSARSAASRLETRIADLQAKCPTQTCLLPALRRRDLFHDRRPQTRGLVSVLCRHPSPVRRDKASSPGHTVSSPHPSPRRVHPNLLYL